MRTLTKEEVLSISIGLDTENPNYIENDGLEWLPIFIPAFRSRNYTTQFLKDEHEEYYSDSRCLFRYQPQYSDKPRYLSLNELSSLTINFNNNHGLFKNAPIFIKSYDALIYNNYIDNFTITDDNIEIDLDWDCDIYVYDKIYKKINYHPQLTNYIDTLVNIIKTDHADKFRNLNKEQKEKYILENFQPHSFQKTIEDLAKEISQLSI